jgi:hypothetical protein
MKFKLAIQNPNNFIKISILKKFDAISNWRKISIIKMFNSFSFWLKLFMMNT